MIIKDINPNLTNKPRKCKCLETETVYNSIAEASKVMGESRKEISKCINYKTNITAYGYHFIEWRKQND